MSSNEEIDYFETVPDEVIRRVMSYLPGRDRIKLQLLNNKRIRGLAISMTVDSSSFESIKTESDLMMLLNYSNLRRLHVPSLIKSAEEWFMSFARQLSLSCPLIEHFSVFNDAIQLVYYYLINLNDGNDNRICSLEMTVNEKMEEIPFATMIVSVIESSKKLSHVSLTCKIKVPKEAMDIVINALKMKKVKSMSISLCNELVYFLNEVHNLEKLSIFDSNELDNSYLNQVINHNSNLSYLHVTRYGIYNSFNSLSYLNNLHTLIIDLRNSFGLRLNEVDMISSFPPTIKTLMVAFNCIQSTSSLISLPTRCPNVEKLYFCSRFPRAKRTPNRFNDIIDIFVKMKNLKELFVSIESVDETLDSKIREMLPKLTKLIIMTRGRDEWTRFVNDETKWNNM